MADGCGIDNFFIHDGGHFDVLVLGPGIGVGPGIAAVWGSTPTPGFGLGAGLALGSLRVLPSF